MWWLSLGNYTLIFGMHNLQVAGSVGKGLAIMSMDQEYVNRFHQQPLTYQQRLLQGLQAAGVGSYEGVIGEQPFH